MKLGKFSILVLQLTRSHAALLGWKHSTQSPAETKRQKLILLKNVQVTVLLLSHVATYIYVTYLGISVKEKKSMI